MRARWHDRLDGRLADAVRLLAHEAARADGSAPLNDEALLGLDRAGRHLTVETQDSGRDHPVAYAQLADGVAQFVVVPHARRTGLGTAIVRELQAVEPAVRAWAFGDGPGARGLAARFGFVPVRALLLMGRELTDPLPSVDDPPGVRFATFVPGTDDAAWLAVNARAFADHPEQGRMTQDDLDARKAADWFDPAGFILAKDADATNENNAQLGFHWTKSHDARTGEVYVLGVDPAAGGRGLGSALLDRGVRHLRDTGHRRVILYVEADHERVVGLYRRYGFTETSRDVMYAQPAPGHAAPRSHEGGPWT